MWESLRYWGNDALVAITSWAAKGVLIAAVPVVSKIEKNEESLFIVKSEVKEVLKENDMLESFESHKLTCAFCKSQLSFDNLGLVSQHNGIKLYCNEPGCTLQAH